jgi:hypothetical protein
MVTQMYFPGEALNETDGQLLSLPEAERPRLIAVPQAPIEGDEVGAPAYGFDITLKSVPTAGAMAPEALQDYVGSYRLDRPEGPLTIEISRDAARLLAGVPPIIPAVEIRPLSEGRFSFAAIGMEIAFLRDAGGRVDAIRLHSPGRPDLEGKRVP